MSPRKQWGKCTKLYIRMLLSKTVSTTKKQNAESDGSLSAEHWLREARSGQADRSPSEHGAGVAHTHSHTHRPPWEILASFQSKSTQLWDFCLCVPPPPTWSQEKTKAQIRVYPGPASPRAIAQSPAAYQPWAYQTCRVSKHTGRT